MKRHTLFILLAFSLLSMASCKQGQLKFKDPNDKDPHVYGDIDGPARQLKNTYPAATAQTAEIAANFRVQIEDGLQK